MRMSATPRPTITQIPHRPLICWMFERRLVTCSSNSLHIMIDLLRTFAELGCIPRVWASPTKPWIFSLIFSPVMRINLRYFPHKNWHSCLFHGHAYRATLSSLSRTTTTRFDTILPFSHPTLTVPTYTTTSLNLQNRPSAIIQLPFIMIHLTILCFTIEAFCTLNHPWTIQHWLSRILIGHWSSTQSIPIHTITEHCYTRRS
mmetsp:Transcript_9123/g.33666  ORF Transcript_9123/g.33666 Transcript_9123/m.33666 type:complete len:202 (-) Transcript_9123:464-1069(-)